jgi:phospholipase/lecithinase/hemolysin
MSLQKVVSQVTNTFVIGVLPLAVIVTVPKEAKAATLATGDINSLYVFGDSLSDTGNVFTATNGASPPAPYFQGRFSNGEIWIDKLSQKLGLPLTPAFKITSGQAAPTAGINFAVGGSTTGTANTFDPNLPGLQQQVGIFSSIVPTQQAANPNALYVLWGGANDYLPTQSTTFVPYQDTTTTINNLSSAAQSLANRGAKNIMVVDLPDLGEVPLTRGTQGASALSNLTTQHNSQLVQAIKSSVGESVNIIPFQVSSLFEQTLADPSKFGFTNTTEACLNPNVGICPDPNQYLFWDQIHPTAATHQVIADAAFNTLQAQAVPAPPATVGLLIMGALSAGSVLKSQKKQKIQLKRD